MFVYRSRFLTRGEVWYDEEPGDTRVDWVYHRQRSSPLANCSCKDFYTLLIDLQKSPPALLAQMDERTARRITDAQEKDKLHCERFDSKDSRLIDAVEQMWNEFAIAQKTPLFEREWLDQFRLTGTLDIAAAKDQAGNVLTYHLVFLTPKRARQLVAISPYKAVPSVRWRDAVSRANCLVHWHNFLRFREQGISDFDFGGWYPGTSDIRLLGINRFKKSFGGVVVQQYDCEQPLSVKGRLLLATVRQLTRLRHTRQPASPPSEYKNESRKVEEHEVSPAVR
jgi:hypothetical protein